MFPQSLLDVRPRIPVEGLAEVARAWNGAGGLYAALAASSGPASGWGSRDIERRARRVLLQELRPLLAAWPTSPYEWIDALPAESSRLQQVSLAPTSGTDWVATRQAGWPPRQFVGTERKREPDTLLVTTLRWGLEELKAVVQDARSVHESVDEGISQQVDVALQLLEVAPVEGAEAIRPTRADLASVGAEGRPWLLFSPVVEVLRRLNEESILELAGRLVVPDKDLSGHLFHLAVFGELLRAIRNAGAEITPIRPLSAAVSGGPAYRVRDQENRNWDLWFEAAGVWSFYGVTSPYALVTAGVPGSGSTVGADIALVRRPEQALIIECKSSAHPSRVARDGYHQIMAYAAEAERLVSAVTAVVVGSSDIVKSSGFVELSVGRIGVVPPECLAAALEELGIG